MAHPLTTDVRRDESALDSATEHLRRGAERLSQLGVGGQRELIEACLARVAGNAVGWVEAACQAKRLPVDQPVAAEEILAGPAGLLRYLRLLAGVLRDVERHGKPVLPGVPRRNSQGRVCVPVLPVASLYDRLIFWGMKAEVWLPSGVGVDELFSDQGLSASVPSARVAGVLGAGNVSAIPATDMLHKIFHAGEAVVLKLNPVNDYLEPFFSEIFRPLIDANLLRIVRGGREVGEELVTHPQIDSLHITGSHLTHDAIVWGATADERLRRQQLHQPLVTKPITSELGNVTPWIIVPGHYSRNQLRAQAEHVVASIVNNASYNCVATKMIVTSRKWPQRDEFVSLVEAMLRNIPPRFAYYPGAVERFARGTGQPAPDTPDGTLPWTLLRDVKPDRSPHLFGEESFVCVSAETALDEGSPPAFLDQAVDFANDRLFGTLCATVTLPPGFQTKHAAALDAAITRFRYGAVCINQWSGIVYGMMTPPWGGYPGATIASPHSGIGHVHNTYRLQHVDKTVLWGPLCNTPKPVWFPSHRTADHVGWALMRLYAQPSLLRLPAVFYHALTG